MKLTKEFTKLYTKISKKALRLAKLPKNLKQFVTFTYDSTIQKAPICLYYCGYFVDRIPLVDDNSPTGNAFYTLPYIALMIKNRISLFAAKQGLVLINKALSEGIADE